ncbi:MAG TPA: cytochrome c oxidase assembly protein [Candidatus Sulfotelmatobacter sp.]|nr:cytochrome c oxidase assembly protein [Candidatus Sulfotelmatobacter sp.]
MPHTHHASFESFLASAVLILAALIYVRGWIRIRRLERDIVGDWRAASFLLGLFLIWLAIASPIAALDHRLLTVHMIQHLLLITLAPPLIWLGAPMQPLTHGLPQRFVGFLAPIFRWAAMQRLGKILANPTLCWLAATCALIGWHIPSLFALGLRSEMWHGIEQASFLISGVLFWWPVIRPWPTGSNGSEWSIILYLFLATLPCDILSGFLVFCDRVVYPVYFSSPRLLEFSALEDQQCAGALMWTCVTVVYLVAGTIVAARLLLPQSLPQYRPVKSEPLLNPAAQTTRQSLEVV